MSYTVAVRNSASEERLQKLIQERLAPGADKPAVDRRIWDLFGEEWAVMFTDLAGFSRNAAEFGIVHFLQIIYESQRIFTPCIERHGGILLKTEGDSLLIIFRGARQAIACAVAMQDATRAYNVDRDDKEQILLGVGIGCGRVLRIGDQDVFGAEVNAASKLGEDIAQAGEILITESARDAVGPDFVCEPLAKAPPGARAAFRLRGQA